MSSRRIPPERCRFDDRVTLSRSEIEDGNGAVGQTRTGVDHSAAVQHDVGPAVTDFARSVRRRGEDDGFAALFGYAGKPATGPTPKDDRPIARPTRAGAAPRGTEDDWCASGDPDLFETAMREEADPLPVRRKERIR